MTTIADFFFQIILFLSGAVLGVVTQMATKPILKLMAGILAVVLIVFSSAWLGYEIGSRQIDKTTVGSCADYGIRIVAPQPGAGVQERFQVSGTYTYQPPDEHVFLYLLPADGKTFWPQGIVEFNPSQHTWVGEGALLGASPVDGYATVIIGGNSNRVLYDYYWRNGLEDNYWSPFEKLTDDTEICDQVFVRRKQ